MGTLLAPETVRSRLSNPSLSPTRPIHGPDLTSCELVCVPGRSMGGAAGAADGAVGRGHVWVVRRARWMATAVRWAVPRRPRARFCQVVGGSGTLS